MDVIVVQLGKIVLESAQIIYNKNGRLSTGRPQTLCMKTITLRILQ